MKLLGEHPQTPVIYQTRTDIILTGATWIAGIVESEYGARKLRPVMAIVAAGEGPYSGSVRESGNRVGVLVWYAVRISK